MFEKLLFFIYKFLNIFIIVTNASLFKYFFFNLVNEKIFYLKFKI